jgi:DNA-directed RNA polymerase subunit RPC12/RpoP
MVEIQRTRTTIWMIVTRGLEKWKAIILESFMIENQLKKQTPPHQSLHSREVDRDVMYSSGEILHNLKEPARLQCWRCGHEWLYTGMYPHRARCTYCGTTVMVGSSRVDR